jgi:hypothetical protein
MEDLGLGLDLRRLEWVVLREHHVEFELTLLIARVMRPVKEGCEVILVVRIKHKLDSFNRVLANII